MLHRLTQPGKPVNGITVMVPRHFFLFLIFITSISYSWGQSNQENLLWSKTRKLEVEDFIIKTKPLETTTSFAQFSLEYQVSGFDFLTKNFNKKVRNYFIRTASWIDTTTNVNLSLAYEQTLWDICEIYTRQFRKALRDNRKKIANGTKIAEQMNNHFMTEFAKRRVEYHRETKFGADEVKQKEWEIQIQTELAELANFAYDK